MDADNGALQEERNSLQFHPSFLGSNVLCLKMDADNGDPSGFNSFRANNTLSSRNIELNKKRKLQADQLGLPIPKHRCWAHLLPTEPLASVEENQEIEDLFKDLEKENADSLAIDDDCSHESVKDSNSFMEDSESVSSLCGDPKFDSEVSKAWSSDMPSTSSFNFGCSSFTTSTGSYSFDTNGVSVGKEEACLEEKLDPENLNHGFQISHYHEDPILEFGSNADYIYPGCDEELMDSYADKELDDVLHSNTPNPNLYVLSSGRWSVNQDSQPAYKKPTIDQEFEQYFSTLML